MDMMVRRKKWTDALRSGEYVQSKNGKLRDEAGFCCLGVAGHIAGIEIDLDTNISAYQNIKEFYGLEDSLGEFSPTISSNGYIALTDFNDNEVEDGGMTFEQIADFIDSCPEGLFINEN